MAATLRGPGALTKLADLSVTERMTPTRNLTILEKKGFIRIDPGKDRRERQVTITKHGQDALMAAIPLWETAATIFSETRPLLVLEGMPLPVVKAEHLIALKVFAMKNDPERPLREMAHLQQLLRLPGIDHKEVRRYFERYGQLERYQELSDRRKTDAGT
jgi:DNA-binding MarR family transcriptional regulator